MVLFMRRWVQPSRSGKVRTGLLVILGLDRSHLGTIRSDLRETE